MRRDCNRTALGHLLCALYGLLVAIEGFDPDGAAGTAAGVNPGRGRPRRRSGAVALVVLIVAGLGSVAGGGAALRAELTRSATPAEAAAAGAAEVATRWTRLPAGRIFPPTVSYFTSGGLKTTAYRVGIAPKASCATALDPQFAAVLRRRGCITVLRATYVNTSGTQVATEGVAVLGSAAAAREAMNAVIADAGKAGLRPVRFPDTQADLFGDAQRGWLNARFRGPYAFFYAAGFADGRPGVPGAAADAVDGPTDLGTGVLNRLVSKLAGGGPPCAQKDIRC